MLDTLINQLREDLQMEDLIQNLQDHYLLPFDENIEVEVKQTENGILLKGVIGPCPKNNPEAFIGKTMDANLFGRGTRKNIIGLTEDGNMLTLSGDLRYNSPYREFKEKLEDFVSIIDYWRNEAVSHH